MHTSNTGSKERCAKSTFSLKHHVFRKFGTANVAASCTHTFSRQFLLHLLNQEMLHPVPGSAVIPHCSPAVSRFTHPVCMLCSATTNIHIFCSKSGLLLECESRHIGLFCLHRKRNYVRDCNDRAWPRGVPPTK